MPVVLLDRPSDQIAVVTLNRPPSLNAMNLELVSELDRTLEELGDDDQCRVIVLTGAGRGFCAGHELDEMDADYTVLTGLAVQEAFADLTVRLCTLRTPIVAAVNGPAAGGGLALALASDTRVCSESARFNAAFVRIGLSGCDVGVSYLLPRIVGPTLAFEMMLTGRLIDAEEARRAGLVLDVVPDGKVVDAALAIAERIVVNSPFGVRMTKQVMWSNLDAPSIRAAIELENRTQILASFTSDGRQALKAFIEKRAPSFSHR